MSQKLTATSVLLVAFVSSNFSAFAAQVTDASGKVLVDGGQGFAALALGADVQPGSKVFVGKDSFASLTYNNGCRVEMLAGTIAVVAAKAPCAKNAKSFTAVSKIIPTQAAPDLLPEGDAVVTDPIVAEPIVAQDASLENGTGAFLEENALAIGIAGVAVAGGAALVLSGVLDDDKTPATP